MSLRQENSSLIARTIELESKVEILQVKTRALNNRVQYLERETIKEPYTRSCVVNVNEDGRSKAAVAKGRCRVAQEIEQFIRDRVGGEENDIQSAMLSFLCAPHRRPLLEKALQSSGLEEQFYKSVVDEIEEFWSTDRVLAFKSRCGLSRRVMVSAALTLGSTYDASTDKYSEMVFKNGVRFPSLLTHGTTYQLDALSEKLYGTLEPIEQPNGKRVDISVLNMMDHYLTDPESYLYNPTEVRAVLAADAAGLYRNVSHVNVGITLLPGLASSFVSQEERDTVTEVHTVCCFEGNDKLQDLVDATEARLTPELEQLHDHGINIKCGEDIQDKHVKCQMMMAGVVYGYVSVYVLVMVM